LNRESRKAKKERDDSPFFRREKKRGPNLVFSTKGSGRERGGRKTGALLEKKKKRIGRKEMSATPIKTRLKKENVEGGRGGGEFPEKKAAYYLGEGDRKNPKKKGGGEGGQEILPSPLEKREEGGKSVWSCFQSDKRGGLRCYKKEKERFFGRKRGESENALVF